MPKHSYKLNGKKYKLNSLNHKFADYPMPLSYKNFVDGNDRQGIYANKNTDFTERDKLFADWQNINDYHDASHKTNEATEIGIKDRFNYFNRYTENQETFNAYLKQIKPLTLESRLELRKLLYCLAKLSPVSSQIVYRGCRAKKDVWGLKIKPGDSVRSTIFTSTSLDKRIVHFFAEVDIDQSEKTESVIFTIQTLSGRNIAAFSSIPGEREILLPPDRIFLVEAIDRTESGIAVKLLEIEGPYQSGIDKSLYDGELI
jgi:hypothetical protein